MFAEEVARNFERAVAQLKEEYSRIDVLDAEIESALRQMVSSVMFGNLESAKIGLEEVQRKVRQLRNLEDEFFEKLEEERDKARALLSEKIAELGNSLFSPKHELLTAYHALELLEFYRLPRKSEKYSWI